MATVVWLDGSVMVVVDDVGRFGEAVGKAGIGGVLGMWEIGMMLGMMVDVATVV